MLAICNADAPVAFKAPKPSLKVEKKKPSPARLVAELHKEAQQATSVPTSLGVTSEEGANPQLSSGMSTSIHSKPIYSASIIIHSEFASKHDVSANSKAGADSGLSAPKDSISQTIGNDEGPNKLSLDHMFAGTNPSVLVDKTKSIGYGLKTAHTETCTNLESNKTEKESKADEDVGFGDDEFNTSTDISSSDDTTNKIKLEDLSKLTEEPKETKDALASHPPSLNTVKIQELNTQLLVLQTLNSKLIREKEAADAEAGWFKAQPSYPNVEQLTHLLTLQWELPAKFLSVPTQVASVQAKIKTLDALLSLLNKATEALNKFSQVIEYASKKAGDHGVPSADLAGTHPVEGEKNTQQFIISWLFQRKAIKDAENANLNKSIPTTTPATSTIPPIITTTTTQLQFPFLPSPPNSSSQPERELIKKDKGK
ncbi:hypothetical protein Tco_0236109 [Tanacetum coccineum]